MELCDGKKPRFWVHWARVCLFSVSLPSSSDSLVGSTGPSAALHNNRARSRMECSTLSGRGVLDFHSNRKINALPLETPPLPLFPYWNGLLLSLSLSLCCSIALYILYLRATLSRSFLPPSSPNISHLLLFPKRLALSRGYKNNWFWFLSKKRVVNHHIFLTNMTASLLVVSLVCPLLHLWEEK